MAVDRDRFHRAARDGYLDLLAESTRKDCNSPDEDGMTPTLWASYHGHLDALRLLVGRGGDPNKCDYFGNTALHCSCANGHLNCVSFLVNFGVNLWALDNDFHTAKDIAAMKQREDILRFLDDAITRQSNLNKKHVQKMKEKSIKDTEKRVKLCNKLQKKALRRAEKDEKELSEQRKKMSDAQNSLGPSILSIRKDSKQLYNSQKFSDIVSHSESTASKKGLGGVSKKILQKKGAPNSDFMVREMLSDGKKSVRSLSGLKRDSEIMYVEKSDQRPHMKNVFDNGSSLQRALSEPGYLNVEEKPEPASIFERPGFGSVAFRNNMCGTLFSLPPTIQIEEESNNSVAEDSIGSAGSLAQRNNQLPWDADQLELDDEQTEFDPAPLLTFLTSNGLSAYAHLFTRERIDIDALMLLNEDDFKELGLPLGPRKKLTKALLDHKDALDDPGEVMDSYL